MLRNPAVKILSLYLSCALFLLAMPAQGWAMFLPLEASRNARTSDISTVQTALETSIVKQRLMDMGLHPDDARKKIQNLSDEQVHQLATQINSLQAGGDAVGSVVFLLLVAIVVVVVLQATGHDIIIRR